MKKIVLIVLTGAFLLGCGDKKAAKKAALDSVISIHDNVMAADDQLLKNKRDLDTLIKKNNLSLRDSAALLSTRAADADSAMDIWMHNFDFEHKGKSDDETITYMHTQKKQIMAIDSQMTKAVAESNKYLAKIKKK
jgi:hypothetical protein